MAIIGRLEDVFARYGAEDGVRRGLEYLVGLSGKFPEDVALGISRREEIDGDLLFALHQAYRTKPISEGRLEAHRRHIDIQCILGGEERILLAPLDAGRVSVPYDETTDVEFFEPVGSIDFVLKTGMVAIFFPEDLHAPSLRADGETAVQKTVVKVKV
jgi:YhcH/YjgK/YiaL family protein